MLQFLLTIFHNIYDFFALCRFFFRFFKQCRFFLLYQKHSLIDIDLIFLLYILGANFFFACCVNSASFPWGFQMTSKLILNRTRVGKMTCQFISKPYFMYKLNLNFGSEITLNTTTNQKEKKSSWMTNYFVIRK